MQLIAFLTPFAGSLGIATASAIPTATGLVVMSPTRALLKQGAILFWEPPNAYQSTFLKKAQWERLCEEALLREGCDTGMLYGGRTRSLTPSQGRGKAHYLRVVGSNILQLEEQKRMRVYEDGTYTLGWDLRDKRLLKKTKSRNKNREALRLSKNDSERPAEASTSALAAPGAYLQWEPKEAYHTQTKKRAKWEILCEQALTGEGCDKGILHEGQTRSISPDPEPGKTRYLRVTGSSMLEPEHEKQIRVFEDGSATVGWSDRDKKLLSIARSKRKSQQRLRPAEDEDGSNLPADTEVSTSAKNKVSARASKRHRKGKVESAPAQDHIQVSAHASPGALVAAGADGTKLRSVSLAAAP